MDVTALPVMTDIELRQFVLDYADGRIYTNNDLPSVDMSVQVFMPLLFSDVVKGVIDSVGLIWEYRHNAIPKLGINGQPIFRSCTLMRKEDWDKLKPMINAELDRRKAYLKG